LEEGMSEGQSEKRAPLPRLHNNTFAYLLFIKRRGADSQHRKKRTRSPKKTKKGEVVGTEIQQRQRARSSV